MDASSSSSRRSKIRAACEQCRERKVRCDGVSPVCGKCNRRRIDSSSCSFARPSGLQGKSIERLLLEISSRLERVEKRQANAESLNDIAQQESPTSYQDQETGATPPRNCRVRIAPQRYRLPSGDAMGTTAGKSKAEEDLSIFGATSNLFLLEVICEGAGLGSASSTESSHDQSTVFPIHVQPDSSISIDMFILPQKLTAYFLMERYWQYVHPMWPVLSQKSIMTRFERAWAAKECSGSEPQGVVRQFSYSIFNAMFALSMISSSTEQWDQAARSSWRFMELAKRLIPYEVMDKGCLELVQALLLLSIYLQSTHFSNRCWITIGNAVRVAQGIGMHLGAITDTIPNQEKREEYRRTWHACILFERLISMSLGRPSMVAPLPTSASVSEGTYPALIDDSYLTTAGPDGTQPPHIPCEISAFVFSASLSDILARIILEMNSSNQERIEIAFLSGNLTDFATSERINMIYKLDSALDVWEAALPPYMRRLQGHARYNHSKKIERQRVALRCRMLHVRLLLLRSLLVKVIISLPDDSSIEPPVVKGDWPDDLNLPSSKSSPWSSTHNASVLGYVLYCASTAQELVKLISSRIGDLELMPPWWHTNYHLFTAGLIILGIQLVASQRPQLKLDRESLERHWTLCLETLQYQGDRGAMGQICHNTLRSARQRTLFHRRPASFQSDPSKNTSFACAEAVAATVREPAMTGLGVVQRISSQDETFAAYDMDLSGFDEAILGFEGGGLDWFNLSSFDLAQSQNGGY